MSSTHTEVVKVRGEVSDYASPHGLLGSGKIISVGTTVNETGANTKTILGLVTEKLGETVVTSNGS